MLINQKLLAARHALSTDPARYNLNGLHFRDRENVTATDGHRAIRIHLPALSTKEFPDVAGAVITDDPIKPFIMPGDTVQKIRKAIPKRSSMPILCNAAIDRSVDSNGEMQVITTDLESTEVIRFRPIDGTFPDVDAVDPDVGANGDPLVRIGINAAYLKDAAAAIQEFTGNRNAVVCIRLRWCEDLDLKPMILEGTDKEGGTIKVIQMPMRLDK